ncbi:MAG TPA: flagellar basal-body rod protein FlgF [Alphaproteobacteria bacterium]|nr:flagellar basal-body rod protein FlgF [Alphaproteobacteria bacterium]
MKDPSYIGLSLQVALQRRMDVIANNVANLNSTGFKAERQVFVKYLMQGSSTTPGDQLVMPTDVGSYRDFSNGPITTTGNQLDVALSGSGFLSVQGPNGTLYTRGGSLAIANDGTLVDQSGHPVLDQSGSPIVIQQDDNQISISQDGVISARRGQIAQLGVFKFDRPNFLQPIGGGLYQTTEPALADDSTTIHQGALEGSNVQAITEMTKMIDLQRSYETVANLIQTQNDTEKDMISKLSNTTA